MAVLVEGRTEKLALPYAFRALGFDADRLGISIVECGGKGNIPVLARVCRATGIPFVVLHDRDAPARRSPNSAERQLNDLIRSIAGTDHVVPMVPDFEGISGLPSQRRKPEHAWRRFQSLTADGVPRPLAAVVRLAVSLADPDRR